MSFLKAEGKRRRVEVARGSDECHEILQWSPPQELN